MTAANPFAKSLADVHALLDDGKLDRAWKRVEELRKTWPGNSSLSLLAARIIQLQEDPEQSLPEVKRLLQQAVELDRQSPAAAIELACFLDNVEDDPHAASKTFAQAVFAARQALIEGLLGQARALLQLDNREDAIRALIEALQQSDKDKAFRRQYAEQIDELFAEFGQVQHA